MKDFRTSIENFISFSAVTVIPQFIINPVVTALSTYFMLQESMWKSLVDVMPAIHRHTSVVLISGGDSVEFVPRERHRPWGVEISCPTPSCNGSSHRIAVDIPGKGGKNGRPSYVKITCKGCFKKVTRFRQPEWSRRVNDVVIVVPFPARPVKLNWVESKSDDKSDVDPEGGEDSDPMHQDDLDSTEDISEAHSRKRRRL